MLICSGRHYWSLADFTSGIHPHLTVHHHAPCLPVEKKVQGNLIQFAANTFCLEAPYRCAVQVGMIRLYR